jgi:hypothetical protein
VKPVAGTWARPRGCTWRATIRSRANISPTTRNHSCTAYYVPTGQTLAYELSIVANCDAYYGGGAYSEYQEAAYVSYYTVFNPHSHFHH